MKPAISVIDGDKILKALGLSEDQRKKITYAKLNIFDGGPSILTLDVTYIIPSEDMQSLEEILKEYILMVKE